MAKKYILAVLCVAGGAILLFLMYSLSKNRDIVDARGQLEVAIVLTEEGFVPEFVQISPGTAVIFTTTRAHPFWPASNEHPSHTLFPAFDPKRPLASHESWSFTFDEVGERRFHDHIRSYYTGTMYVE